MVSTSQNSNWLQEGSWLEGRLITTTTDQRVDCTCANDFHHSSRLCGDSIKKLVSVKKIYHNNVICTSHPDVTRCGMTARGLIMFTCTSLNTCDWMVDWSNWQVGFHIFMSSTWHVTCDMMVDGKTNCPITCDNHDQHGFMKHHQLLRLPSQISMQFILPLGFLSPTKLFSVHSLLHMVGLDWMNGRFLMGSQYWSWTIRWLFLSLYEIHLEPSQLKNSM